MRSGKLNLTELTIEAPFWWAMNQICGSVKPHLESGRRSWPSWPWSCSAVVSPAGDTRHDLRVRQRSACRHRSLGELDCNRARESERSSSRRQSARIDRRPPFPNRRYRRPDGQSRRLPRSRWTLRGRVRAPWRTSRHTRRPGSSTCVRPAPRSATTDSRARMSLRIARTERASSTLRVPRPSSTRTKPTTVGR